MRRPAGNRSGTQQGFTLVELMMAVAILGIGTAFITNMFLNGYNLWKKSFDELLLQQAARRSMALISSALREASPGSVQISTPAGLPKYSQISFLDGRNRGWIFRQKLKGTEQVSGSVFLIEYVTRLDNGLSSTRFLAEYIQTLSFIYPSFQDVRSVDVGITMKKTSYSRQPQPVVVQIVERVLMRNP